MKLSPLPRVSTRVPQTQSHVLERFQELRQIARVVLQVRVHGDKVTAAGGLHAGPTGRRFAAIIGKALDAEARICRGQSC